ncbi:hypothetical protein JL721_6408 [Aureococcus anophagefferens]|nr:hypothetical protein JL721_6408 [Aureococcus anophagefferens]
MFASRKAHDLALGPAVRARVARGGDLRPWSPSGGGLHVLKQSRDVLTQLAGCESRGAAKLARAVELDGEHLAKREDAGDRIAEAKAWLRVASSERKRWTGLPLTPSVSPPPWVSTGVFATKDPLAATLGRTVQSYTLNVACKEELKGPCGKAKSRALCVARRAGARASPECWAAIQPALGGALRKLVPEEVEEPSARRGRRDGRRGRRDGGGGAERPSAAATAREAPRRGDGDDGEDRPRPARARRRPATAATAGGRGPAATSRRSTRPDEADAAR